MIQELWCASVRKLAVSALTSYQPRATERVFASALGSGCDIHSVLCPNNSSGPQPKMEIIVMHGCRRKASSLNQPATSH